MTLQQAKDQTAQRYGYSTWWALDFEKIPFSQEALRDQAAELYARSKFDEAVDDQRLILSRLFDAAGGTLSSYYTMNNLKKPEFKP